MTPIDQQETLEAARVYAYDRFPTLMAAASRYRWELLGRSVRPSHGVKHLALRRYASRYALRTLIETGTYRGHMVASTRNLFASIYSIELNEDFYQAACKRFAAFPHIHLIHGDSANALPQLLATLSTPCLFWLDAHYSGAGTARGDSDTPILAELRCVLSHRVEGHVVLIDDACDFNGNDGYPTLSGLRQFVAGLRPNAAVLVQDNIIRIV